ncbi:hypothetical protein [Bacteroides ihuae]|uniref:hypothetical protein n=1 Tax=Bacteroides ihuae TaxID=1852362 RepID=UPI0008D92F6F|nr:hypothetical protein [Bacteroides ihuae]
MDITKAKITKDNTIVATYTNENGDTVTIEGKNIVHKDLTAAFSELIPHLTILCEQKEADGKLLCDLPDGIYSKLEVSGYSMGGSDDSEGVTLTGKRFLMSKKVLNLNAPFTMFNNENEEYEYALDLYESVQKCSYEVEQYLFEKKWAVVQQELPFKEGEASDMPFEDINPDAVAEAVEGFENAGATFIINGEEAKPKKSRKSKKELVA